MFRARQGPLEPEYPSELEDPPLQTVTQRLSNRGSRHEFAVCGNRKTFADRLVAEAMKQSQPGCLMNTISAAWVYLFHAVFRHTESVEKENDNIRMNLVQQDLAVCAARLNERCEFHVRRAHAVSFLHHRVPPDPARGSQGAGAIKQGCCFDT